MMPPPETQIYHWPRVTLIFDLLTPKVDRFMPLPRALLAPIGIKIGPRIMFTSLLTDERTDGRTDMLRTLCIRLPIWPGVGESIIA